MPDITMNVDDTLELDTIIEESTRSSNPVTNVDSSFEQYGIQTHTHILNPTKPGDYTIKVNGQELTIKVNETNSIPEPKHWYDATEISGSNGDSIDEWADKEGSADLTQTNSSKYPTLRTDEINGKQAVYVDADRLSSSIPTISQPYEIFGVLRVDTLQDSNNTQLLEENYRFGDFDKGGADEFGISAGNRLIHGSRDTTPNLWNGQFNGSSSVFRFNADTKATGSAGTKSHGTISTGASYSQRTWCEILVYSSIVSTSGRNDIENYLIDKWGL